MDIILYNPLSRNGKNNKTVLKLAKKLSKKGTQVEIKSLLEITDIKEYLNSVNENDRFIILGGDGTLNNIANQVRGLKIKQDVLMMRGGTGNDFARSVKIKKRLVSIKKYFNDLPHLKINDEEMLFLNGVGIGLDGMVVHRVNESSRTKSKRNYFGNALFSIRKFKPQKSIVTLADGNIIESDKTWFVVVMNSKFFGGGMRIAPKANRLENDLDVIIVRKIPRYLLLIIFPMVYLGLHVFLKKYVKMYKTTKVNIKMTSGTYVQVDGEDYTDVKEIVVERVKS